MLVGYARVSTVQQDTALQRAAFMRAGVRKVVEEKRSGGGSRPLLEALLGKLKPGDVVVVYKIDRLARSLVDLLRILQRITDAGAQFRSLTEPLETATPVGRMMLQLLGAFAEFERALIRERCCAGLYAAMARGVAVGRRPRVQRADVVELRGRGLKMREVAELLGCSAGTVSKIWHGQRVADRRAGAPGATPAIS
ncbi:recombinase family protein [Methylibium petroleiphilum]|uniref:recombinase family protein n=1 Tax=Methylibium petroleiphilum TaxID=105560 RepID=UPI003D2DB50D